MKRQTKTLIAVLGVFVLLCGALAAVLLTDPGEGTEETSEAESEPESISLVAREYAELVSVSVQGVGELYAVGTGDATTEIPALSGLPVNAGSLAYIAKYATTMTAQREIDASAGLEEFGLADNSGTPVVTVKYTDGAEVTLRIGDEVPAASPSSNYVLFDGKVYTMYHAHLKYFLMEPKEYLDTDITPTSSDSSTGNYLYELVSMTVGGRRLEEPFIVYAAGAEDDSSASVFTADVISAGGEIYPMASDTCLKLIYSPFDLDAADIVSYFSTDEDLAACGLDDPWATVDLQATYVGDGTGEEKPVHFKLLASEPDADGRVCVMIEGVPVIYAIDEPTGDSWYRADYRDYVSSYMLMPSVSDVDELSLETPDGDFVFGIQHGEAGSFLTADAWSSYPGTPSSAVLSDAATFSAFYETLVGAENDGWAEVPADTELVSVLKVTYRYADGEDTLEFFEGPARQNYVAVNGTVHFVIRSSYTESVIAAASALMTGSGASESS
ncbi:MAG TPA: DUF4340 domain-containing protein [Oscillospiraceae bacterium]|nr:DUF4340 domain-containing protein [Oscillospiraceae bacterium]HRW57333.1 DUF4340 domain-containing protein [Oscillospiraceae bacterium]